MTTLVVPVDQTPLSEAALPVASTLAARLGASVRLVTVTSPGVDPYDDERYLKSLIGSFNVPVTCQVLWGNDVDDAILEVGGDPEILVCMGAHGRTGLRLVLGSVSEPLIRKSRGPVVLVGPNVVAPPPLDRMVVCLDGSPLAERVLAPALRLARRLDCHVELLHVAGNDASHEMHSYLQGIAARVGGVHAHVAVHLAAHTDPARVIAEHAAHSRTGLVAMTTHGRTGVPRALFGSVTQSVVHRALCPVLVVSAHG
jgi:nucleotide-binding universal stress UspA family protein